MGGYGSGRWYRYNTKRTCEQVKCLDIRELRKKGGIPTAAFMVGSGSITWSSGDQQTGSIEIEVRYDSLDLTYAYQGGSSHWQDVNETISFERTPCNYGGERVWFLCPQCDARVAVLYSGGPRFLCRRCQGLNYGSQHEGFSDRMMRKARKIRKRLGATANLFDEYYPKPKGMHWNTFTRLRTIERQTWVQSVSASLPWLRDVSSIR